MDWTQILNEIHYRTSRSSGAGGQHVNKTETKVEALWNIQESIGVSAEEKVLIVQKLASRISDEGILSVSSQKSRSQVDNKQDVLEKLHRLLTKALTPVAKRIKTKPSAAAVEERLADKRRMSELKESRRKPGKNH